MNHGKSRSEFCDVAKGIGILLVILGHLVSSGTPLAKFIFGFHMPLFFFLSGFFAAKYLDLDLPGFCRRVAQKLMLPYLFFIMVGCTTSWLCYSHAFNTTSLYVYTKSILWGSPYYFNSSIWFLFALGATYCVLWMITSLSRLTRIKCPTLAIVLSLLSLLFYAYFGIGISYAPEPFWFLVRIPFCLLFVTVGMVSYKKILDWKSDVLKSRGYLMVLGGG